MYVHAIYIYTSACMNVHYFMWKVYLNLRWFPFHENIHVCVCTSEKERECIQVFSWLFSRHRYTTEKENHLHFFVSLLEPHDKPWCSASLHTLLGLHWKEPCFNPQPMKNKLSWHQKKAYSLLWTMCFKKKLLLFIVIAITYDMQNTTVK